MAANNAVIQQNYYQEIRIERGMNLIQAEYPNLVLERERWGYDTKNDCLLYHKDGFVDIVNTHGCVFEVSTPLKEEWNWAMKREMENGEPCYMVGVLHYVAVITRVRPNSMLAWVHLYNPVTGRRVKGSHHSKEVKSTRKGEFIDVKGKRIYL